jgi:hypothetical protein
VILLDWIDIGRDEAVRNMITTSIDLYFANRDPASVHLLASSSVNVLRDLCKNAGVDGVEARFRPLIKVDQRKTFTDAFNRAYNTLKHADRDPTATVKFTEQINAMLILTACLDFEVLFS